MLLALPALYAEIYIGNQAQKNPVSALAEACGNGSKRLGRNAGIIGLVGAIMMLSFYTIVAGWMLAHALSALTALMGFTDISNWLSTSSTLRNLVFTPVFIVLGAGIIHQGVHGGIERWSSRLMPMLLLMLIGLIVYILQLEGAQAGLALYLIPDFAQVSDPKLIISAMGQAFFSLSIGVGGMMVYGSYMKKGQDLGKLVVSIAALDTFIAFLAGLLIIPAMYVAQAQGVAIFAEDGSLISGSNLVFTVLPSLFSGMGTIGLFVGFWYWSNSLKIANRHRLFEVDCVEHCDRYECIGDVWFVA